MGRALRRVLFAVALVGSSQAYAKTDLLKTQPGSVVHWSRPTVTVAIDPSARSRSVSPDDAVRALELAIQTWNKVQAEQPKFRLAADTVPDVSIRFCRGRWQGDSIDLGRSNFTASLRDGTVTAATVEINECDHGFAPPEQSNGYDLQAVLTHELGHVLGLGHSDNRAAIMYPSGGGASVRAPHVEDQTTLALIYFGRASTEPSLPLASVLPGKEAFSSARAAEDTSLQGDAVHQADDDPDSTATPPAETAAPIATDFVPVLSLQTSQGRSLVVYTCEPTLLPPIESAPTARDMRSARARHARRSAHRH
jgi:predicted Zn-dependent protease